MILDHEKIERIRNSLKFHPKGMSITELARQLKINRNSVAKYLEILLISGQVEATAFGTSKVYSLSRRMPVSAMMSFSSDMILMIQSEGTILQCNDAFLNFTGLSRDTVIGENFSVLERAVFPGVSFQDLLQDGTENSALPVEMTTHRDGREYILSIKAIPTTYDDGNKGLTFIIEDISEKTRAERTLAEREKVYRGILESIQDVYYRSDREGNLIMASPSWASLLGYASTEECLGRSIANDFYLDPRKRTAFLQELERKGSVFDYEVVLKKKDGSPLYVSTNSHNYYDEKGNVLGVEGIFRDSSERRASAERIHQNITRIEFLSKTLLDFVVMDPSENIYQRIAADLHHLVPDAIIFVNSFNPKTGIVRTESGILTDAERSAITGHLGNEPLGLELSIDTAALAAFQSGSFHKVDKTLHELVFKGIPEPICQNLEKDLVLRDYYAVGFIRGNAVLGNAVFFLRKGAGIPDPLLVGMYARQASIVLQRFSADEAKRKGEKIFFNLAQASPLPIAIIETDGTYRYINESFTRLFGYDLTDFHNGREWFILSFPDPEVRKQVIAFWKQDLEQSREGESRTRTFIVVCKDQSKKEIVFRAVTLWDGTQYVIFEDVTERHDAEQVRRILSSIVESTGDAVIGKDINGFIISWNRAAEYLYGYTRDEMIGRHISLIIPPERRQEMDEIFEKIRRGESVHNLKTLRVTRNGTILNVAVTVSPIIDENGVVTGASTIAREIPSDLEFSSGLMRREVADIIECIPDATFIIDSAKCVVAWNTAMEQLYDLPREKILKRDDYSRQLSHTAPPHPPLIDLLDAPDPFILQYYPGAFREGTALSAKLRLSLDANGKTGESIFQIRASPITDAQGNRIGAIQMTRKIIPNKTDSFPSDQFPGDTVPDPARGISVSAGEHRVPGRSRPAPGLTSLIYLSNALRRTREGIVILDLSARCIWVNDAMTGLLGLPGEDAIVGKSFAQFIPEKNRKIAIDQLSAVYRKGSALFACSLEHPAGPVPVEASVSIVADNQGSPLGYMAILRELP